MAAEIIPIVQNIPVIAGICGTDPFKHIPRFLKRLRELGFAGVQNFPTVGLIDSQFRTNLEETGMGYSKEMEMVRQAAKAMTEAGAEILVAHMGLTTLGVIGAKTGKALEECLTEIQAMRDAAVQINKDVIVLCHGGLIAAPEDARFVLDRVQGLHGFYGASSMKRLPVEVAIKDTTAEFKKIGLKR